MRVCARLTTVMRIDESCKTATYRGLPFVVARSAKKCKIYNLEKLHALFEDWVTSGVVNSYQLSPRLTGA